MAPRVIVVGAGPAGIRAAETLVAAGVRPVLVNESAQSGGQIYRRQPAGFQRSARALYGTEAGRATALHAAADAIIPQVEYWPDTLAWNVTDGALHMVRDDRARALHFDALIIAAGATDRLIPIPGWTLPGAYTLGAAQIALKAQACAIGQRVVFMGSGPLLYLVAAQYVAAGATVMAVLDTAPTTATYRALPWLMARPGLLAKGAALMWRLRRAGVTVLQGVVLQRILGSGPDGVTGVAFARHDGSQGHVACDAVGLGWHLRAESQLADLAGCDFGFDADSRQWLPRIDASGRSSVGSVYLAGDGVRLLGADGAENAGRLAALAALQDLGHPLPAVDAAGLLRRQRKMDRFHRGLARAFPWPAQLAAALPDDAMICRCEAITAGTLRHGGTALGAPEVNRAKALTRVGMGRCQGRFCGLAAAEILAAARGIQVEQVGRLRGQAPVKPLPIATVVDDA